jgi:predicted nucleotidyltransferase
VTALEQPELRDVALDRVLATVLEPRQAIAYALVFGSRAGGAVREDSDLDVAVALQPGTHPGATELGALIAELEAATGLDVDVTLLDEAPASLAFRVFQGGRVVLVRDRSRLVARRARAILDYLDFQGCEARCVRGVLRVASHG